MGKAGISKVAPIGKRFGRLVVCSPSRMANTARSTVVDCRCDCGDVRHYFVGNLSKMIGEPMCPICKPSSRPAKGQTGHPLFNIWKGIIQRCENPKHSHYDKYGAKGVVMCRQWRDDFNAFAADMGQRLSLAHTIDRIEATGNYEPGNCRWATPKVQGGNRRPESHHFIEWHGESITIADGARRAGISKELLHFRIKSGWCIERAMTTPARKHQRASPCA